MLYRLDLNDRRRAVFTDRHTSAEIQAVPDRDPALMLDGDLTFDEDDVGTRWQCSFPVASIDLILAPYPEIDLDSLFELERLRSLTGA